MQVIKPVAFLESMLISSNATEPNPTYAAGTTYAKGARVYYLTHIYESLVNSNVGHTPTDPASATFWLLVGPGNIHSMYDSQVSTVTTSTSPLVVTVKTGPSNTQAFIGLVGLTLQVVVRNGLGGPIIYDSGAISLDGTVVTDWYAYYFEEAVQRSEVIVKNIPVYYDSYTTITLTGSGTVACGVHTFGTLHDLGLTQWGASIGIVDYSRKDTDDYGNTTFTVRAFSNKMNTNFMLMNTELMRVKKKLEALRATPCVWIGSDAEGFEALTVYGWYKDFSIEIPYLLNSYCSLEVEGLT